MEFQLIIPIRLYVPILRVSLSLCRIPQLFVYLYVTIIGWSASVHVCSMKRPLQINRNYFILPFAYRPN